MALALLRRVVRHPVPAGARLQRHAAADADATTTVFVDPYSGRVLADIGFTDYSLLGKAMTLGVPLHQGSLGGWNLVINLCFCLAVIALDLLILKRIAPLRVLLR